MAASTNYYPWTYRDLPIGSHFHRFRMTLCGMYVMGTGCGEGGMTVGLLDVKGNIYVESVLEDHQPARDLLLQKMSEQVTVTGTLVTKGGMKMLFIKSVQ